MSKIKAIAILIVIIGMGCGGAVKKSQMSPVKEADPISAYQAYQYFVQGNLYEEDGNLDSAAVEYRKALIYDPNSTEIKRSLSEIDFQMKKFDEAAVLRSEINQKTADDFNFIGDCLRFTEDFKGAADYYQRSLEMDSTQIVPRYYLARIMQFLGKNDLAEKHYRYLTQYSPDKLSSYMDLAAFYLRNARLDKALDAFSKASAIDSMDARPVIGMGSIYIAKGDTVKADSVYMALAKRGWDDSDFLNALIPFFFGANDIDDAEKLSARVVELTPDDSDAVKRHALILFSNKKTAEAESLLITLDQKGQADAAVFYYLGRINQERKEYPKAEQYLRKSLALADTMTDAWVDLALVVDQEGKYEDAIQVMGEAVQMVPEDSNAILFYTAVIHGRNQHYDLARDGYLRLLQSNPNDMQIVFNLAATYERMGQFEDAEKDFKTVIQKDPKNALALNYLGYMYAEKGVHLKEAREMLEKALKIDPENGAYLDSYAWVLYKMGKYDEALVQMKRAFKDGEQDPTLYDHQGDIYMALNQRDMARGSWTKALELKPDDEAIKAKLNQK